MNYNEILERDALEELKVIKSKDSYATSEH